MKALIFFAHLSEVWVGLQPTTPAIQEVPYCSCKVSKQRISGVAACGMWIIQDFHLLLVDHFVLAEIASGSQCLARE